jgi:hypothetical protein
VAEPWAPSAHTAWRLLLSIRSVIISHLLPFTSVGALIAGSRSFYMRILVL